VGSHPLAARPVRFEYPADLDPVWNRYRPELACAANALSLLMPHVEPYVVRSTRAVLDELPEPLRSDAVGYVAQEASHHAQHRRFNELLIARVPSLRRLDRLMGRTYRWLARRRSVGFGVAFAAGSEAIAFGAARWVDAHYHQLFADADPTVADLFLWHLAEEVEHKSVAFDVHTATGGSRRLLAGAMAVSLVLLAGFTIAGTLILAAHARRLHRPLAWARLITWSVGFAFEVLPAMALTLVRGHHPDQLADPPWLAVWLEEHGRSPIEV
jgi:uncharacterized protein